MENVTSWAFKIKTTNNVASPHSPLKMVINIQEVIWALYCIAICQMFRYFAYTMHIISFILI